MEELDIFPQKEQEKVVPEVSGPPTLQPATAAEDASEDDLYIKVKKLCRQLDFLQLQEDYIRDELKNLKCELLYAQEEVKRIQPIPLVIGQFLEAIDQNYAIVGSTTGSNYYVRILSTIDRELFKLNASVALYKHSNALVNVLPPEVDSSIALLSAEEKPDAAYSDGGGLDIQKQEVQEAVELPLTYFDLYRQIGIDPPWGVLMYGPPGCGKTMLAKAVAHHTFAEEDHMRNAHFAKQITNQNSRELYVRINCVQARGNLQSQQRQILQILCRITCSCYH